LAACFDAPAPVVATDAAWLSPAHATAITRAQRYFLTLFRAYSKSPALSVPPFFPR